MDHEIHLSDTVDRVIHVPLTEAEWKAFLATTPQPINWLRDRIKEAIENHTAPATRES